MEDLMSLPGVGRKTANVVMLEAFNKPQGIAIDTHAKRICNKLGLSNKSTPEQIEQDLLKIIPQNTIKILIIFLFGMAEIFVQPEIQNVRNVLFKPTVKFHKNCINYAIFVYTKSNYQKEVYILTNINCSANCLYQKDGKCSFENITTQK